MDKNTREFLIQLSAELTSISLQNIREGAKAFQDKNDEAGKVFLVSGNVLGGIAQAIEESIKKSK